MKRIARITMALSVVIFSYSACTDHFDELNTSRSLITEDLVDVDMMFTRVLAVGIIESSETGFGTTGNWAGMSVSGANRPFDEGGSPGVWNDGYGNYVRNLSDIIHLCSTRDDADQLVNKKSIARIMKVWAFAKITDTYGDVPYFDSGLPVDQAKTTPEYTPQRDIYVDFFKELKEAVAEMDDSKPSFGNADLVYGGNIGKWKKFANSLRLRLALRVRYADAALAQEQMSDLTEADLITTRADDAYIENITDFPNHQNPRYNDLLSRKATTIKAEVAKTFLDILLLNDDPRLHTFADTARAWYPQTPGYEHVDYFGYRGRPLLGGSNPEEGYAYGDNSVSQWSDIFWVKIQEQPLFRASETYFNLAEAALFGLKGSSADAQGYFEKGVELALLHAKETYEKAVPQLSEVVSLFQAGKSAAEIEEILQKTIESKEITQADIDAFMASPALTLTGSNEEQLEQIINQKIIALFPMEHEGWVEHRRTGYPRILVGEELSSLQGKMPRRMPYPDEEQLINRVEYTKAVGRLGGADKDNRLSRFWWDANPDPHKPHPGTVETRTRPWTEL